MKKIKNAFGRLYLKNPQRVSIFAFISFLVFIFSFFPFLLSFGLSVKLGGFAYGVVYFGFLVVIFFLLFACFKMSKFWAKKLPECTIREAEKILEIHSASPDFRKLKELIQQAKQTKKTEKLEEWIKDFKEFNSIRDFEQEFNSFKNQFEEWQQKVSTNAQRKVDLKLNLFY
jgi:hypothetical protein